MKVFGPGSNFDQNKRIEDLRKGSAKAGASSSRAGGSTAKGSETVAVSGAAREVAKVSERVRVSPDVRKEKVEELRGKIEKGEYYVSGDKIAGKVIEDIIKGGS